MSSDYSKASDEKIIKAVIQGDTQAYGELYKRYLDDIYRYVYYRAVNHLEVEDLIQEVFIKAWEVILKNQPKKYNFRALVYRIAHNLTVDRWRTKKQEISLENVESLPAPMLTPEQLTVSNEESLDRNGKCCACSPSRYPNRITHHSPRTSPRSNPRSN